MVYRFLSYFSVFLLASLFLAQTAVAKISVRIDSPANGTVISAGQVIDVVVKVDGISDEELKGYVVTVIAPWASGESKDTRVPGGFASQIIANKDLQPGYYSVIAVVARPDENSILSEPIDLVIPTKPIVGIGLKFDSIMLSFIGESDFVQVVGLDADGREVSLSDADRQKLKFSVSNSAVASVDGKGRVTALSPGLGWVYVTLDDFSAAARLMVDVSKFTVRGDFTNDGVINEVDIATLRRYLGGVSLGKDDTRDLNGDGKIDELDLQVQRTLCSHPNCDSSK